MSITPVLTRLMERLIVTQFLYPAITSPSTIFKFSDQYAFRPTGSPTAAILISLLYMVTHQLLTDTRMSVRNHRKALHTLPVSGGALPVQQVDKDLMLFSFDEVNVVVLFSQTNCHLPNYAVQQMKDYYGRTLSDASMLYFADVFYIFLYWPP